MNNQQMLIEKYLAGTLSSLEREEVCDLIKNSAEFKAELTEAINTKGLIYSSLYEEPIVVKVMEKVLENDQKLEDRIMGQIPKKKTFNILKVLKLSAAAAIILFFYKISSNKINSVTSIKKSVDTVIKRANGKSSNSDILMVNDLIQTGDSDQNINFDDGTKLDLKGKSELKLVSKHPKIFKLNKGSISAEVSPQDKPLKIETSSATIEVLGTVFNLTSQEQSSLLKVTKGKVAITDKKTGERALVTKGEYTIAEGKPINVRKGKGPLYVSDTITSEFSKRYIDIEVNLSGEKRLVLVTTNGDDSNLGNHTAWLNPVINVNGRWTSLTKIKPQLIKVGKGTFENYVESKESQQLLLHGKSYVRGLYAHATSVLIWDLPAGTKILKCRGAILDSALKEKGEFSARFEVYTDISKNLLDTLLQKHENF